MVRGEAILVILTIFIQLNTGSVFDKFSTPEKKDKNKMLMYLRGLLNLDSPTTRAPRELTTTAKLEKIFARNSLPDRRDKSKMLSYLRGLNAPGNVYSIYEEPEHRGLIQTLQNQNSPKNAVQNTQNNQNINNNAMSLSDKTSDQQVLWANPATELIILQPAEKESESDTCFWRGQQSNAADQRSQLAQVRKSGAGQDPPNPSSDSGAVNKLADTKMDSGFSFENMGENIIEMWACAQRKFWKSYYRLQKKICNVF